MVTVKELKKELKEFGLPVSGLKAVLIDRLETYKADLSKADLSKDNIWEASAKGNIQAVVEFCKDERNDINQLSVFDRSALHQASLCGQRHVIYYLIKKGAYDYNGNAYLSGTPLARDLLRKHGFRGKPFLANPDVKLLNSKRKLCLLHIDELKDYDLILIIQELVEKLFTDKTSNHKIFQRFLNE